MTMSRDPLKEVAVQIKILYSDDPTGEILVVFETEAKSVHLQ